MRIRLFAAALAALACFALACGETDSGPEECDPTDLSLSEYCFTQLWGSNPPAYDGTVGPGTTPIGGNPAPPTADSVAISFIFIDGDTGERVNAADAQIELIGTTRVRPFWPGNVVRIPYGVYHITIISALIEVRGELPPLELNAASVHDTPYEISVTTRESPYASCPDPGIEMLDGYTSYHCDDAGGSVSASAPIRVAPCAVTYANCAVDDLDYVPNSEMTFTDCEGISHTCRGTCDVQLAASSPDRYFNCLE